MQKRTRWFLVALAAGAALLSMGFQTWAEDAKPANDTVALVNGVPIMGADLEREITAAVRYQASQGQPMDDAQRGQLRGAVLENLIAKELIYQECAKLKITLDEGVVNSQLDTLKKGFPSEEEFKTKLSALNLTEEILRAQFERGFLIQKYVETQIVKDISVVDLETRKYYDDNTQLFATQEQVRARHILISVDEKAEDKAKAQEAACAKLMPLKERIEKGEDFATLAKEHSDCPSAKEGGDLGFFGHGQMVPEFDKAAFALKPGEVSDIVKTEFGCHLIKVEEKRPAGTMPYEEVKDKLEQGLKQQKIQAAVGKKIEELKAGATIERLPDKAQQ